MNLPDRLGKYPVTEVLGKGAMGIVYRAYDPVIKRPVAIKTIRKELIEDDEKAGHQDSSRSMSSTVCRRRTTRQAPASTSTSAGSGRRL